MAKRKDKFSSVLKIGQKRINPIEEEAKQKKTWLFDFLSDISNDKLDILTEENEKQYIPYIIHRFLSSEADTLLYANEMNIRPHLSKQSQYQYLLTSIRKRKRYFKKWESEERDDKIALVSDYYSIGIPEAKSIVFLHTNDQFEQMRSYLHTGRN